MRRRGGAGLVGLRYKQEKTYAALKAPLFPVADVFEQSA
jgi:hypothetical protein